MIKPAMIPPKIGAAQYNQWNSQNPEIKDLDIISWTRTEEALKSSGLIIVINNYNI